VVYWPILPVAEAISLRWGILGGDRQLKGIGFNGPDGLIAATALEHDLTVVTRSVKDFAGLGLGTFNPWDTALRPVFLCGAERCSIRHWVLSARWGEPQMIKPAPMHATLLLSREHGFHNHSLPLR